MNTLSEKEPPMFARMFFLILVLLHVTPFFAHAQELIVDVDKAIQEVGQSCKSFFLDTESDHAFEINDHHQSLTQSHVFSDGSILTFMSHSETGDGDYGQILVFKGSPSQIDGLGLPKNNVRLALNRKIRITEQHPSGIAWLKMPSSINRDAGILVVASENEKKVRFHAFDSTSYRGEIATLLQNELDQITDVWLMQDSTDTWLITHNMNKGEGVAYRSNTSALFQQGTHNEGHLNVEAFTLINHYQSPLDTGCGKSLGQNAILAKDKSGSWFVIHLFTGNGICGANNGDNILQAFRVSVSREEGFQIYRNTPLAASAILGSTSTPFSAGADGAAGLFVDSTGGLVALLGAQYATLDWFDWQTSVKVCSASF